MMTFPFHFSDVQDASAAMFDWDNDVTTFTLSVCLILTTIVLTIHLLIKVCKPDKPIRSDTNIQVEENRSYLPLMKAESSFQVLVQTGVSTVSFFSAHDVDYEVSKQKLKARLKKICEANPWLLGTIVKDTKRHERILCSFPNKITDDDMDAIFFSEASKELDKIGSSTPYTEMATALFNCAAMVRSGVRILNTPARMCKVSFYPMNGGKEFAFVFSLAHVIADGHTYYKLLSMFKDDFTIESLEVQRMDNIEEVKDKYVGKVERQMSESFYIKRNISRRASNAPSDPKLSANYLDLAKIARLKQEAKDKQFGHDPNFYVSTNDIVTSAFGNALGCELLWMLVNLRGRVRAVNDSHAGNYQAMVWLGKNSYDSPSKIRQTLSRGPPFKRISEKDQLTRWQQLTTEPAMISSWVFPHFDADIHLWQKDGNPSSLAMLHLPLYAGSAPYPTLLVFKPSKGKLAVFCFCTDSNDYYKKMVDSGNLLGEIVRPGMFAPV